MNVIKGVRGFQSICRPIQDRFNEKWTPEPNSRCWLWTGSLNNKGYGNFYFGGSVGLASRASWILFRGDISLGMCVLHHCDTPACVNPNHLFLGTQADNISDCVKKNRHGWAKGESVNTAKLTSIQVLQIRALLPLFTTKVIAKRFNVCNDTIWSIKKGKSWKHV